ncbi:MAG TPA: serine/threonine-protein kinase [Gemmataceae bacterium]|nr:serine/threonine-protein kinase [Gemmataceae bacterium]
MEPRNRRPAAAPSATPEQLLAALLDYCLLPEEELHRVARENSGPALDVHGWVNELVGRNMLTPYQAELLLEGRGAALVLGPYRILDWLGAGGMGQVYKAEHTLMKRVVALKVMAAEPGPEADRSGRGQPQITFPSPFLIPRPAFLREVQAAARLHHPNIVAAFDAAEIDGLLVLVMEYVEGADLERRVEEHGPLPVPLACECIRQAALGLQHAFERGLVHGDIKPSNLLLSGEWPGEKSEVREQGSEVRGQGSGSGGPKAGGRSQRSEGSGQESGDKRKEAADGGRQGPAGNDHPMPRTPYSVPGTEHAHSGTPYSVRAAPCSVLAAPCSPQASRWRDRSSSRALQVKILDLGLARLAGRPQEDRVVVTAVRDGKGQPTGLAGTPDFMAPELAHDSQRASIRSDLYSLGCTFYYLLTGQVPFPADTWTEKLLRHQFDPAPSVRALRPDVPMEIEAMIRRLLAKDPARRYPTPAALAAALGDWLSAHAPGPDPALTAGDDLEPPEASGCVVFLGADDREQDAFPDRAEQAVPEAEPEEESVDLEPPQADSRGRLPADAKASACSTSTPAAPHPGEEKTSPVEVGHPAAESRGRLGLTMAVLASAAVGLVVAGLLRWGLPVSPFAEPAALPIVPPPAKAEAAAVAGPFEVRGAGRPTAAAYSTLAAAIAAAHDGDEVIIHGNGPFLTSPLAWSGKALALRAAPGSRPRLRCAPAAAPPGTPLLAADRSLRIEGLDLEWPADGQSAGARTHLVYCDRASLRLADCGLEAAHGSALVVVRGANVDLQGCRLDAGALALCVEAAEAQPCEVRLTDSRIQVHGEGEVALSIWAPEGIRPAPVRLYLEKSRVRADRVVSFRALAGGVEVTAKGNHFTFRRALASFVAFPGPDGWRRTVAWRGQENTYQTAAGWLQIDGALAAVHRLEEWQALWDEPEPGSVAEPLATVPGDSAR